MQVISYVLMKSYMKIAKFNILLVHRNIHRVPFRHLVPKCPVQFDRAIRDVPIVHGLNARASFPNAIERRVIESGYPGENRDTQSSPPSGQHGL